MKTYPNIAIQVPDIFLPRQGIELNKWAVIACDQFTSQPEYWRKVEEIVGQAPSTLKMIFPEVYLDQPSADERIRRIQQTMQDYISRSCSLCILGWCMWNGRWGKIATGHRAGVGPGAV